MNTGMGKETGADTGKIGSHEVALGSESLLRLRESGDALGNARQLRERLEEDGYLFFRGFHPRDEVMAARREMLAMIRGKGRLDPDVPEEEGAIGSDNKAVGFRNGAEAYPLFRQLADSARSIAFFESLLDGPCLTYDTKWFRAVARGQSSGVHYDVVYMGKGTKQVYTMWCPLGDIPVEMGGLAVCVGSHRFGKLRETYGASDYDEVEGWFSNEPLEVSAAYGGRWASEHFRAGDAVIFGMYTMHCSLVNQTDRYRLSCDLRFQRSDEPVDPRWHGNRKRDDHEPARTKISMGEAKQRWGLTS